MGDFTIIPRQRFNGLEMHRTLNFHEITADDYAAYNIFLQDILNEIVHFSRLMAGETGFMNVSLQGNILPTDIKAVLTPDNNHDVSTFIDQIERAVQSNADVGFDSALMLCMSVARNRQCGGHRKLTVLAHNMVIPKNITDNMCFSICLAHFLNSQCPDQELVRIVNNIHADLGYWPQDKIAFHNVSKFETAIDSKIVIFHRSCSGKLEVYTNTDETHQDTVHLYLHDDHYYMIKNLKAFLGYSCEYCYKVLLHVCEYCYKGFNDLNLHYCTFICNVCNTPQFHMHSKKWVQCEDCARYWISEFCYEMR